jgi:hypothetical protein
MPWWLRLAFMFMAMKGDNVESSLQQMGYMAGAYSRSLSAQLELSLCPSAQLELSLCPT